MAVFDEFKRKAVCVYVNSKSAKYYKIVSGQVIAQFREDSMGRYIPKAVIASPENDNIWGSIAYKKIDKKNLRELSKTITLHDKKQRDKSVL